MWLRRLSDLPLLVLLMALSVPAMLVPAAHAFAARHHETGRIFLYSALIVVVLSAMIGIATAGTSRPGRRGNDLKALVGAYLLLPVIFAVPLHQAVPDTSFLNAWFEMLSSFTTTGATVYDASPDRLGPSLHLWRGLVGWLGGFYILLMAVAVLLPMNLGGMEVLGGPAQAGADTGQVTGRISRIADPGERVIRFAVALFPVYAGLTAALWLLMVLLGETGLRGLCLAMAVLSTSGILPQGMAGAGTTGIPGEMVMALFLVFALTRRFYPGPSFGAAGRPIREDPELRMAAVAVLLVTVVLFLRHWVVAIENAEGQEVPVLLHVFWGSGFTALSFLTTTGIPSAQWGEAQIWSGHTHGLILLGLAIMGGGAATTAGGVKLLRITALFLHGQREMERLIHPHSVGGGGPVIRRLRGRGAHLAWLFFMLFALSIAVIAAALTLTGQEFNPALILAIASLSNTGQIASLAGQAPVVYADLSEATKLILGFAMILGRVEVLALLALLTPEQWRK
ncbi:MAG: TrkH family potassium uptake protein [Gemmobacter sp.]|jgi:trk system potassium uptake protein TrkH|nr:TrkH family potassium uptake protein [Gemmobacter sp.]